MKENTVAELETLFEKQRKAFSENNNPSYEERMGWLKSLEQMMMDLRHPIREAISKDFDCHSPLITDMFETGGVLGRCRNAQASLKEWMAPVDRPLSDIVHGSSNCQVIQQPKGVMGNISPWNFPIECSLVMVCDMLAAGNRVIVKASELAPATAKVLQDHVGKYFPEEVLAIVVGGISFSQHFASMRWDHLTYTGNTEVGRLIMKAAAENLTPVTLELGGKNPTIFLDDGVDKQKIREYLSFKFCKSGQICTSPDYAMVPENLLEEWLELAQEVWQEAYPNYSDHPDVTGIINERHFGRLLNAVEEAKDDGCRVIALSNAEPVPSRRQLPMYLVVSPRDELMVMREETFGPITPVLTYKTLDEAYEYINNRERPLASYLVTQARDPEVVEAFKKAIVSGGAGINVFGFQAAEPTAPFGGIGASGIGAHGGPQGFANYSHSKTVYNCTDDNPLKMSICVPYGEITQAFAEGVFAQPEQ
ncbi:aldehyde dehydrogenase family protein [Pseudomaricurvus alkylphenolicus]|uniref:aldehyde dehydrogenase family protein n=1 Tax=Pseudomaricurvus alkylphenolicus TaxID=1306991 RepID=UPI00142115CA|nr:aldehyde dehydrogenase family protein [Pseudomaricurvus alkylphenolicus]NIB42260.1 aldehyde dehydrogenase family protein [Pseudomaricurvus alkylphenolicus]